MIFITTDGSGCGNYYCIMVGDTNNFDMMPSSLGISIDGTEYDTDT